MNLAGQLKVLSDSDMQMVHEKALELLEEKGVVFQSDKAVETFRKHGAKVTDHTVMIPKDMVMKALSQCPPSFLLEGMNPDKNVTIGEGLAIHPAGVFQKQRQAHSQPHGIGNHRRKRRMPETF